MVQRTNRIVQYSASALRMPYVSVLVLHADATES